MSSVKVVDLNEEVKEEPPAIGEALEEEQPLEITNDVVEETNEEVKEEPKEEPKQEVKPKAKAKTKPNDLVFCETCNRQMTYKNLRYSHKCSPEPPPVKTQANPKPKAKQTAKPTPKPKQVPKPPEVNYSDSDNYDSEDEVAQKPL